MSDRLAEIQRHIDTEPVTLYGLDVAELASLCIQVDEDRTWLLARVRELEARAARGAAVVEAALEIYPDLANAPVIAAALAAREAE